MTFSGRPFLGTEAVASGRVTAHDLRCRFDRIHRNVYVSKGTVLDAVGRAHASWLWSGRKGVLAGMSAAAVHGTRWIDDEVPPELAFGAHVRAPKAILVRKADLAAHEVCTIGGLIVTTPARTAFDLGRALVFDHAVETLDALCNATGLPVTDVFDVAASRGAARGVAQLRRVLAVVDGGAESPPETRTRLLLVRHGLPAPETQLIIRDGSGRFLARADMGWGRWKVIVEYDGEHHWTDRRQRARDIDRYAVLEENGWRVVRVGAVLLRERPHIVVERVRRALDAAGARW
ncbi:MULTISPECIES: DUF559 domain-containing protein [Rhodococcus]|uniref:DUF559 domain-containing protein n=1 Tax=Rhodococcus TaxID=1827 RepID=UPI0003E26CDC|nr:MULTISPECIES: DUF559 domain-containing protein [Rhodococcus]ETT23396.1 protein of unknown function DUF4095 [Rhodococcus rhodochrous ATCC 21198]NGP28079.1 DUF559 domain-containing protein [Rhodococcus aetherivorans]QRI78103.1 DUF559 domain-containing protein [Rhodococcus aetherivorans]QSE61518.1 DUF559 domain-containing protein [Rhodococcus sp. PSBB066]QSE67172.1 DUF559 domain-containing protein [Rhodococcus sp. PSBB049]